MKPDINSQFRETGLTPYIRTLNEMLALYNRRKILQPKDEPKNVNDKA